MIELEALNWSFQLLLYIYNMISGMSRADVKNVLLIMHTQESCQRLRPSGVFFKTFSNSSTVIPASFAAPSIVTRPFLTSLTNIRMKAEKRLNGGGFRFWRCCRSTRAFVRIFLQGTRTNIANEVVYHGERLRLFWQRQYRICPL